MAEQAEAPAAPAGGGGGGGSEEAPASGSKKSVMSSLVVKLLIGLAAVVVLGLLVWAGAWYTARNAKQQQINVDPGVGGEASDESLKPMVNFELGSFTTVITDQDNRSYNLKVKVVLSYLKERADEQETKQELDERKQQLADAVNEVLIGIDPTTLKGDAVRRREGYSELRAAINRAVNAQLKHKINNVLIPEYIFQ